MIHVTVYGPRIRIRNGMEEYRDGMEESKGGLRTKIDPEVLVGFGGMG